MIFSPDVVSLNRIKILGWKNGQLSSENFPFSTLDNVNIKEQPKFNKHCWHEAVQKAEKMIPFLEILSVERSLDTDLTQLINHSIDNNY